MLAPQFRQVFTTFQKKGLPTPELDARLLCEHAGDDSVKLKDYVRRRLAGEPVSRILGEREFWSLPFKLSPATLDPRPDSETNIEAALKNISDHQQTLRILDLGTGSGCLLLSLLHELPNATGVGVDLAPEAVKTAQENARHLNLSKRAEFMISRWGDQLTEIFDLVISNPPYIPSPEIETLMPEVRAYDPRLALDGGDDGLEAYRQLALCIPPLLNPENPDALVILEIGKGQEDAVRDLMPLRCTERKADLAGIIRTLIFDKR